MIMHNFTTHIKYTMKQRNDLHAEKILKCDLIFQFQFAWFPPVLKHVLHLPFLIITNDKPVLY